MLIYDFGAVIPRLASLGSAVFLTYITSIILYRLFFHPLAKYPGPLLGRITDWYSVYHVVKGDSHINFYRLHQKHGPIVRFGPNRISFNSVDAVKTIYSSYGQKAKIIKADYYTVVGHHFGALNIASMDDPAQHSRKRRIMAQALTTSAVKTMHPSIWKNLTNLYDSLKPAKPGTWSAATNISDVSNAFTFDTMGDIVFGQNMNMLTSNTNRWILSVLPEAVKFLHIMGHMPALLLLDYLPFKTQMAKDMDTFQSLSEKQAWERIERGPNPNSKARDVFSYLLGAKDPETGGPGMTEEELIAEAGVLMIAGSDTAALAITSTLFYLAKHPTALQRLRTELRDTFPDATSIDSWPTLSSCAYLRACMNEAMRLTPAVGGVLPRAILSPGLTISGEYFPAGTVVGVSSYTINHDAEWFPEPFKFKPERWLNDDDNDGSNSSVQRAQEAFFSFSLGPRGCVGKHLAYVEVSMAVAYLVWHFDIQPADEEGMGRGKRDVPGWVAEMQARGELVTADMFVSHPIDGQCLKFRELQ